MVMQEGDKPAEGAAPPIWSRPARRKKMSAGPIVAVGVGVIGVVLAALVLTPNILPRRGTPSLAEAQACFSQGDWVCARADYRAYLKKYPKDGHAAAMFAALLTRDGRHKEAVDYYKTAREQGISTYQFYAGYGRSLNALGQVDQAMEMNQAAIRLMPWLVEVRSDLADQLVSKGRTDEALEVLETYDRWMEDRGYAPYFRAKIEQVLAKTGKPTQLAANHENGPGVGTGDAASGARLSNIELQPDHGTLAVPVLVNGAFNLHFVVDSGASTVTIPADIARALVKQGLLRPADRLGFREFQLADGSHHRAEMIVLRSLRVGDRELKDVTASISPEGSPLLLGQSFLKRFKSWSVDNRKRVLVLQG